MISEIIIPVMDQTGGDFLLVKWLKHEGDAVATGDVLCEVETDKASVEISAEVTGVLRKVLLREGARVPSLAVIALIGEAGEQLPAVDPYYRVLNRSSGQGSPPPADSPKPKSPSAKAREEYTVSPRARRLAAEHELDLSTLSGSGPDGRIVEDDVRRALNLL